MKFVAVQVGHWVGDFLCQNRYMAEGKSTKLFVLGIHTLVYTLVLFCFSYLFAKTPDSALLYAIINGGVHGFIDYFTSKMSSEQWQKKNMWGFFSVVGFDQMLHGITLYLTLPVL